MRHTYVKYTCSVRAIICVCNVKHYKEGLGTRPIDRRVHLLIHVAPGISLSGELKPRFQALPPYVQHNIMTLTLERKGK